MFNVGTTEFMVIMLVILLLFGAKRIPEVSRALGKGLGDFRNAVSGVERELKGELMGPAPEQRPRPAEAGLLGPAEGGKEPPPDGPQHETRPLPEDDIGPGPHLAG